MTDMTWTKLQNLLYGRSRHVCGVLKDANEEEALVVAGGSLAGSVDVHDATNYVEMLVLTTANTQMKAWDMGPNLPIPLVHAASATTSDGQTLYVIGGKGGDDSSSKSIFKLGCSSLTADLDQDCVWTKVLHELKMPSAMGLAISMPPPPTSASTSSVMSFEDCVDQNSDESILVVTTGFNGYSGISTTETFSFATTPITTSSSSYQSHDLGLVRCKPVLPQAPSTNALLAGTGGVLKDDQKKSVPVLCGGGGATVELLELDKCYHLKETGFSFIGTMKEARAGAASVAILDGSTLWVTGGLASGWGLDTTEWIDVSTVISPNNGKNISKSGVQLPMALGFHCLQMINSKTAILYGGLTDIHGKSFANTWTIEMNNSLDFEGWTPRASMRQARCQHSCGVVRGSLGRKFVVAAGGGHIYSANTNLVEHLEVQELEDEHLTFSDNWSTGPPLPVNLMGGASVTTADQRVLFVVGGIIFYPSRFVYALRCTLACWWTKEGTELQIHRSHAVAMIIPPDLVTEIDECKLKSTYTLFA